MLAHVFEPCRLRLLLAPRLCHEALAQGCGSANVRTIYLVTHAWHMRRAKASFQAVGIEVVAAPTRFASKPTPVLGDFLPTARALEASHAAMYEWLGLLWYTWRYY